MSACYILMGLRATVTSYLEIGVRFFAVLILGYEKPRTAHYHHYDNLVFTDADAIYTLCLKNLAFFFF